MPLDMSWPDFVARTEAIEAENKALWECISALDVGDCERCGKPAIDHIADYDKETPLCPLCLTQWLKIMEPHKEEFINNPKSEAWNKAWETEYTKFMCKEN